jgi:hypothetical protein
MQPFFRKPLLALGLSVVALGLTSAVAQEGRAPQNTQSAQAMLPLCQAGLNAPAANPGGERCMGVLSTLTFVSRVLPDNLKFCQPTGTTPRDMVEAVTSFMTANADAVAQDFRLIALAAMRNKWPCQE